MKCQGVGRHGTLVVLSGPSGAGKTTVYRRVLKAHPEVQFSVSCTTRAPRPGEADGVDYRFSSNDAFEKHVADGDFLEHATVHGNRYGTLAADVRTPVENGVDVLMDIDVQGARQVRRAIAGTPLANAAIFVFCAPPSYDALEQRLTRRGTDEPAVIRRRLANAVDELAAWREYTYLLVNDRVDDAAERLEAIILAARCRSALWHEPPWKQ